MSLFPPPLATVASRRSWMFLVLACSWCIHGEAFGLISGFGSGIGTTSTATFAKSGAKSGGRISSRRETPPPFPTNDAANDKDPADEVITKSVVLKYEAVGGSGGSIFDSGSNIAGPRKIHVWHGPYRHCVGRRWTEYQNTIHRIFLEFGPFQCVPSYDGRELGCTKSSFGIGMDDPIEKIVVWTDGSLVNAIQFHLRSGFVTQLFGSPVDPSKPPVSFQANHPDAELTGIHGFAGDVIDKLGFTFATPESAAKSTTVSPAVSTAASWREMSWTIAALAIVCSWLLQRFLQ